MNKELKEDLRFTIERANEIVRLSENRRYKFLEINLALVTAFSFLLVYALNIFNIAGIISIITSISIYFAFTIINIGYNLKENRTLGTRKSLCSYRDWKYHILRKKMINIKNYRFDRDYKRQIISLHKYQKNYDKIGRNTRIYTLIGFIVLPITLIISIIFNLLGNLIGVDNFDWIGIIIIILSNIIPSIVIVVIFYLKLFKKKKNKNK